MNREVEERLVAMYFDNRDFEKNAKQTIETLNQLKKSMNLEDSVKGFDMFDRMKRNAGMEQMQRSANKLKETFGSVGTTLNKAFQIGTGPLRQFENTLGTMRSYISRYLGFDFASKVVNSVESAVRGLTLQPISQGWGQYEAEVDSVRTIMSSTGRSIDDVTKNLDDLRTYADKTIYSLTDMTSNLGKFTNNGVELEKATQAMMGVANAAALAGQGTQQASMAMYNISQAIGVGKMTSIDWKSIENANMATKELKQTFIDVAAAQNNLKKVEKDGVTTYYYVKDSNGREIKDQKKWVEVNYKNFRETLSKGWLTSDTLTTTLAALSGQSIGIDEWAAMGIEDKELIKTLEEMGRKALEAASQVRTFSKMMTTLKDSVASGWSQSFKFVFGNADEATEFWTSISERIGGVLNESADARNRVLKKWKETREVLGTGLRESGSSAHNGGLVEYTIYGRNGREILIDGLKNLMDVFGELGKAVSRAFRDVFGSIGGEDLFAKTQAFEKLTIRLKEWLGTLDDSGSKLNKIYRIVRGVISGFKLWKNTIRSAADTIIKLLIPGADGVLDILANLGDFLYDLANLKPEEIIKKIGEKLKEAWEKIKSWFTPKELFDNFGNSVGTEIPIVTWINALLANVGHIGENVLYSLGLGDVVEWFKSTWANIEEAWNTFLEWLGNNEVLNEIGQFLGGIWNWIVEKAQVVSNTVVDLFTPGENGQDSPILKWLKDSWEAVSDAWQKFEEFITGSEVQEVINSVAQFLGGIWNWIVGKAQTVSTTVNEMFAPGENGQDSQVLTWLKNSWQTVVDAWSDFESFIAGEDVQNIINSVAQFLGGIWNWIVDKAQTVSTAVTDFFMPGENGQDSQVLAWLKNSWQTVVDAWSEFESFIAGEDVQNIINSVAQFLGGIWNWIVGKAQTVSTTVNEMFAPGENGQDSQVLAWLKSSWQAIADAWGDFESFIAGEDVQNIINNVGQFLGGVWNWIVSKAQTVSTAVTDFFMPGENGQDSPVLKWLKDSWGVVSSAWQKFEEFIASNEVKEVINNLGSFLGNIWGWVVEKANVAANAVTSIFAPKEDGGDSIFIEWLTGFWGKVDAAWKGLIRTIDGELSNDNSTLHQIGAFLGNAWAWIVNYAGNAVETVKGFFIPDQDDGTSQFTRFISGFWNGVTEAWNNLTESIKRSGILPEIGKFLSDTWNWILGLISSKEETNGVSSGDVEESSAEAGETITALKESTDLIAEPAKELADSVDETITDKLEPIQMFFTNLFGSIEKIVNAISEFYQKNKGEITESLGTFFTGLGTLISGVLDSLGKVFSYIGHKLKGESVAKDINAMSGLIDTIGTLLLNILALEVINVGSGAFKGIIGKIFGANSIASDIRDIGMGIALIFGTMAALKIAGVEEEHIKSYGKWILVGVAVIGAIIVAVSRLKKNKSTGGTDNEPGAIERIVSKAISSITAIVGLGVALKFLPEIIKAVGEAKSIANGADIGMDVLLSIAGVIGGIVVMATAIALLGKLNIDIEAASKGALAFLEGFGILLVALWAISAAFPDTQSAEALRNSLTAIGDGIGGLIGGLGTGLIHAFGGMTEEERRAQKAEIEAKQLEQAVDEFLRIGQVLSPEKISGLTDMVNSVNDLRLIGLDNKMTGIDFKNFSEGFKVFTESLLAVGRELSKDENKLLNFFGDSASTSGLEGFTSTMVMIMDMFNSISSVSVALFTERLSETGQAKYSEFFNNFHQFVGNASQGGFSQFVQDVLMMYNMLVSVKASEGSSVVSLGDIASASDYYSGLINEITAMLGLFNQVQEYNSLMNDLVDQYNKSQEIDWSSREIINAYDSPEFRSALRITGTESSLYIGEGKRYATLADYIYGEYYKGKLASTNILELIEQTNKDNSVTGGMYRKWAVGEDRPITIDDFIPTTGTIDEARDNTRLVAFDAFLTQLETFYGLIDKHSGLKNQKGVVGLEVMSSITNAMAMFSSETGIGSKKWRENYNNFADMVKAGGFVEKYVETVEQIYDALQKSKLASDEGITFDGVAIVTRLFEAISTGFEAADLPSINAQPVVDAIIIAIDNGKNDLVAAVHNMIQAGIDETVIDAEENGYQLPAELSGGLSELLNGKLFNLTNGSGVFDSSMINELLGGMQEYFKSEEFTGMLTGVQSSMEESLSGFSMDELLGQNYVDAEGNETDLLGYISSSLKSIQTELNDNPIKIKIQPIFELDQLTRENLQGQLNGLNLSAPVTLPSVSIDFSSLRTELGMDEIKQKLDAIKLAIDLYGSGNVTATSNLGIHMDGIRNEISGLNFVLDTGVLVGQMLPLIDVGLYNRALTQYRTGTAPRNGAVYVP